MIRFNTLHMLHIFVCLLFVSSIAIGHEEHNVQKYSVDTILSRIEQAYQSGEIGYETALLNKAFALFDQEKLPAQFKLDEVPPSKCGTPVVLEIRSAWENLSPQSRKILDSYFQRPSTQYAFGSPSGRFKIHYDTSGPHAVYQPNKDIDPSDGIPDYVNRCAEIFDYCWSVEVDTMGYDAPPPDEFYGGDARYDVYLQHYEGAYGVTFPENPSDQYPGRTAWTSYIFIDPTYDGFGYPDRTDPLSVTSAHELFHAIQFAYNTWAGVWVMEISSVWMEDVIYDDINDYLNYLDSFFPQPQVSLDDSEDSYHPYASCVWAFYLTENYGVNIIRQVWEEIITTSPLNAFNTVLGLYGTTRNEAFREFTVWNYLTGPRANGSHPHYEEASDFPLVFVADEYDVYPVFDRTVPYVDLPNHLASNYVRFVSEGSSGDLKIFFTGDDHFQWRVSVVVDSAEWFTSREMNLTSEDGFVSIPNWGNKQEAVLIPCITSTFGGPGEYSFSAVIAASGEPDFTVLGSDVRGGNGDGYIDPGETVELVLSLVNYGLPAGGIWALLTCVDPDVFVEKEEAFFGTIEENETGDNGADPFLLTVVESAELHRADCSLILVSNGGNDTVQVDFQLIIGHPEMLVVDDDYEFIPNPETFDFDVEGYYTSSLDSLKAIYDYWAIEHDGTPDSSHLKTFQTVIWFTGHASPALTNQDQEHLTAFLESGGNLFITGQDIASDLGSSSFLSDYLHAQFRNEREPGIIYGVPGDPVSGDFVFFSTVGDPGAHNQISPDVIAPLDDASVVFTYPPLLYETAAVKYDGDYRVVFFSFGFEAIVHLTGDTEVLRSQILNNVLSWLSFEPQKADVDANGQINVLDMVRTAQIILGTDPPPSEYELWAADCDGNGTINVLDVLGIANVILGLGTCEP